MNHQGEWVFVADDNEPERVWQDLETAVEELELEGGHVVEGPGSIKPDVAGLDRFDVWGYRLRHSFH